MGGAQCRLQPPDSSAFRERTLRPSFSLQGSPGRPPTGILVPLSLLETYSNPSTVPVSGSLEPLSRGRQTEDSGSETEWGRAPRQRAVTTFHFRGAQQGPATFPLGQVLATGPRRGRVEPSSAAAGESALLDSRSAPVANARSREE